MICHGTLINNHQPLQSQGVTNNSKVLVIMLFSDASHQIVSYLFNHNIYITIF